jgi:hypothetical protein
MNKTAAQKLANDYYHAGIMLAMQEAGLVKESAPRRSIPGYDEAKVELQRENKATTPEAINKQRVRNNTSSQARKDLFKKLNPKFSRIGAFEQAVIRGGGHKPREPSDSQVADVVAKKTKGLKY